MAEERGVRHEASLCSRAFLMLHPIASSAAWIACRLDFRHTGLVSGRQWPLAWQMATAHLHEQVPRFGQDAVCTVGHCRIRLES